MVVSRLGMQYIWIDIQCVVRDQLEDWQKESSRMGEVYRNSLCNIAATGFRDGCKGLFVKRDSFVLHVERILISVDIMWEGKLALRSGPYTSVNFTLWRHEVAGIPLSRRVLVVQERLLSPRTLHFGFNRLLYNRNVDACAHATSAAFAQAWFRLGSASA